MSKKTSGNYKQTLRETAIDLMVHRLHEFISEQSEDLIYINLYIEGFDQMKSSYIDKFKIRSTDEEMLNQVRICYEKEAKRHYYFLDKCLVSLYSRIEATFKELVHLFFYTSGEISTNKILRKLKVPIGDIVGLSQLELVDFISDEYEKEVCKGVKYGPQRFLKLLENIGFKYSVDKKISRDILEMAQVRNNLVHKNGKVDDQLIELCPWLDIEKEQKIQVSWSMYKTYATSSVQFVSKLEELFNQEYSTI